MCQSQVNVVVFTTKAEALPKIVFCSCVDTPRGYTVAVNMKTGHTTRHDENLVRLARIEGQIKGIRGMVEQGVYCVDIITQIQAVEAALASVGRRILRKHVDNCVVEALQSKSASETAKKIDEMMKMFRLR
jgi:CsoR family transcriptional regulator, copper-sensing transcriptional repressor